MLHQYNIKTKHLLDLHDSATLMYETTYIWHSKIPIVEDAAWPKDTCFSISAQHDIPCREDGILTCCCETETLVTTEHCCEKL